MHSSIHGQILSTYGNGKANEGSAQCEAIQSMMQFKFSMHTA